MGTIHELPPRGRPTGNGDSSGPDYGERLAAIEAHLQHVATKADLKEMKSDLLKWQIGILAAGDAHTRRSGVLVSKLGTSTMIVRPAGLCWRRTGSASGRHARRDRAPRQTRRRGAPRGATEARPGEPTGSTSRPRSWRGACSHAAKPPDPRLRVRKRQDPTETEQKVVAADKLAE